MSNYPAPITEKGMRGFLMWLNREQPVIYAAIAPQLPLKTPQAFSDYHNGAWKNAGLTRDQIINREQGLGAIYRDTFTKRIRRMNGLSDLSDYASSPTSMLPDYTAYAASTASPISVDYSAQLTAGINPTPSITVDYSSSLSTIPAYTDAAAAVNEVAVAPAPLSIPNIPNVGTIGAANTGTMSGSTVAAITGLVASAAAATILTSQQQQAQAAAVAAQLARAQAGLSPLNTTLNASGVPTLSSGLSSLFSGNNLLFLLAGGAALLLMSGGGKGHKG